MYGTIMVRYNSCIQMFNNIFHSCDNYERIWHTWEKYERICYTCDKLNRNVFFTPVHVAFAKYSYLLKSQNSQCVYVTLAKM